MTYIIPAAGMTVKGAIRMAGAAIACALIVFSSAPAWAEEMSAGSGEGLYAYDEENPPETFFFPPETARWNGNNVTIREWYMLTELQKEKFIDEYLDEMKKHYQGFFDVVGSDYLRALNAFSFYADDRSSSEPSAKVIDRLLAGQGQIWPKAPEPVKAEQRRGGV